MCVQIRTSAHRSSAAFTREVDGDIHRVVGHFHTLPQLVNASVDVDVDGILSSLNSQMENFNTRGSGFIIERVSQFVLIITKYRPLHGRSFVPTPEHLKKRQCIVNVQNRDEKCFLWAILSCLYEPSQHKDRLYNYVPYLNSLNIQGINFPVETKQIPLFEHLNPEISVNVLSIDEENENGFCVEYLSPERNRPHHINLLLLEDQNDPSKKHYTRIKDMSRLVSHRNKHEHKTFVCNSCLHPFRTQQAHDNHLPYCLAHPAQQVVYPVDNPHLKLQLKFEIEIRPHQTTSGDSRCS